jgi:hypothetical protein
LIVIAVIAALQSRFSARIPKMTRQPQLLAGRFHPRISSETTAATAKTRTGKNGSSCHQILFHYCTPESLRKTRRVRKLTAGFQNEACQIVAIPERKLMRLFHRANANWPKIAGLERRSKVRSERFWHL